MRKILQVLSAVALLATILPALLFLSGKMDLTQVKTIMLVATAGWFVVTPTWMGRRP